MSACTPTYRSVVHNLVASIESRYAEAIEQGKLDEALGPFADVYNQAKVLTENETSPTMFISIAEGGIYDASITNSGLSDISVVVVDETNYDRHGSLMSVGHEDGTVFSARVKRLLPTAVHFDTERVLEVAEKHSYQNGIPISVGLTQAIINLQNWTQGTRPYLTNFLSMAEDLISDGNADTFADFLKEAGNEFKTTLLAKIEEVASPSDAAMNESRLEEWLNDNFTLEETGNAVLAAIYVKGFAGVQEAFDASQSNTLAP